MFRSPCSKCGSIDHPKWYRKSHGQFGYASFCILCRREDVRIKNERWLAKQENRNKKLVAESLQRKGNPYYQKMARKSYWKNREKILQKKRDKYQENKTGEDGRRKFSLIGKIYDGVW